MNKQVSQDKRDLTHLQEISARVEHLKFLFMCKETGGSVIDTRAGKPTDINETIALEVGCLVESVCNFAGVEVIIDEMGVPQ